MTVTYVSPFVTTRGVETFVKLLPLNLQSKEVVFHVITRLPSSGDISFPSSKDIARFKTKFKDFKILKRKSSDGATRLRDGTEISKNPIHLKLIHITFRNKRGEKEVHSIFTSANLTYEAWLEKPRGNIESGIWIKDKSDNQKIAEFIENFEACFSEPDQQELIEIDRILAEAELQNKFEELWFEDLFVKHLHQSHNQLILEWNNRLPSIQNIQGVLNFRNVVTGDRISEEVSFNKKDSSYTCEFKTIETHKNVVLDFIKLTFETDTEPPVFQVKSSFLKDLSQTSDGKIYTITKLPKTNCNTVAINEQWRNFEQANSVVVYLQQEIRSMLFCNKSVEKQKVTIYLDVEVQKHLDAGFFRNCDIQVSKMDPIGEFFEIRIEPNQFVDPPFDTIEFTDNDKKLVEPAAFSKTQNILSYYFPASLFSGAKLEAKAISPFDRYFKDIKPVTFPTINQSDKMLCYWTDAFDHTIAGLESVQLPLDEFLAPLVEIKIQADERKLSKLYPVKYFVKEESFTYRQPLLYEIKTPIIWNEPYSRVVYWGAIELRTGSKILNLISSKKSFTIKAKLINDFHLTDHTYPSFPFPDKEKLILGTPLSWIDLNVQNIETYNKKVIDQSLIELYAWRNGHQLEKVDLNILQTGKIWLIPIAFTDLIKPLNVFLLLKVKGAQSLGYASTFKIYSYKLIPHNRGFKLRRITTDQKIEDFPPIQNNPTAKSTYKIPIPGLSNYAKYKGLIDINEKALRLGGQPNSILCLTQ